MPSATLHPPRRPPARKRKRLPCPRVGVGCTSPSRCPHPCLPLLMWGGAGLTAPNSACPGFGSQLKCLDFPWPTVHQAPLRTLHFACPNTQREGAAEKGQAAPRQPFQETEGRSGSFRLRAQASVPRPSWPPSFSSGCLRIPLSPKDQTKAGQPFATTAPGQAGVQLPVGLTPQGGQGRFSGAPAAARPPLCSCSPGGSLGLLQPPAFLGQRRPTPTLSSSLGEAGAGPAASGPEQWGRLHVLGFMPWGCTSPHQPQGLQDPRASWHQACRVEGGPGGAVSPSAQRLRSQWGGCPLLVTVGTAPSLREEVAGQMGETEAPPDTGHNLSLTPPAAHRTIILPLPPPMRTRQDEQPLTRYQQCWDP